ncbi:hypothetical protein [Catellatospora coxensis]|uniref:hypothetical protein n=1 Tax=Catellatospora coxensis TaxID=310354 RepID=UPI001943EC70|nr:hypothetical protein [Catellatospora coxensis]
MRDQQSGTGAFATGVWPPAISAATGAVSAMQAEQVPPVRRLSLGVCVELLLGDGPAHVTTHAHSIRISMPQFHPAC